MPHIFGFKGIHYARSGDLSDVTAPPYDVISPAEKDALLAQSPQNIIRVTLGGDFSGDDSSGKYEKAAATFREWLASGVLSEDAEECFYLYTTEFKSAGGLRRAAGLVGAPAVDVAEMSDIHPHERTIAGPIQDRLRLTRAAEANLEPLWFFASRPIKGFGGLVDKVTVDPPIVWAVDPSGIRHSLWRVDQATADEAVESLADIPLIIADGHHRYETALAYRRERRAANGPGPWDRTMALIVDPVEYSPALDPIHRIVKGSSLSALGRMDPFAGDFDGLATSIIEGGPGRIGVAGAGGLWIMKTSGELDTAYLAEKVIDQEGVSVTYEHNLELAKQAVGDDTLVFVMAPTTMDLVARKALSGTRMPPKTTLFWPKPRTGLIMRDLSA